MVVKGMENRVAQAIAGNCPLILRKSGAQTTFVEQPYNEESAVVLQAVLQCYFPGMFTVFKSARLTHTGLPDCTGYIGVERV